LPWLYQSGNPVFVFGKAYPGRDRKEYGKLSTGFQSSQQWALDRRDFESLGDGPRQPRGEEE